MFRHEAPEIRVESTRLCSW